MKQKQSETRKIGLGPMQWATEMVEKKNYHINSACKLLLKRDKHSSLNFIETIFTVTVNTLIRSIYILNRYF